MIADARGGATILGAGAAGIREIDRALALAPFLVCADGGAAAALAMGRRPDCVIGDMDSLGSDAAAQIAPDKLHPLAEQNSTDFEKCLSSIAARFYVAAGVVGPRLDHGLASLNVLVRHQDKKTVLLTDTDICFHCPPRLRLDVAPGTRVSLFPMADTSGRARGLTWGIDGLEFSPHGQTGTSNQAGEATVELEFYNPGMLVILPSACMEAIFPALIDSDGWIGS